MKKTGLLKLSAAIGAAAAAIPLVKKKLETPKGKKFLYDSVDSGVGGLCRAIGSFLPDVEREDILTFSPESRTRGLTPFLSEQAAGARWHLGYSKISILPEDVTADKYFIGGYLAFPPNEAAGVLDDQMIRCIALSDGSGRGTCVFAVIDCVGISNRDVQDIRDRLSDFAQEKSIADINISASHSHSCIDTMGVWGELTQALKKNPGKVTRGETDFVTGRNAAFMENLKESAVRVIKEAVEDMRPGSLSKAVQDGSRFVRDKRPPEVMMTEITSLRFVPDDGSRPTRAVMMAAHPTQFGGSNKIISGDYPYYLCEEIEKNGENALFFQGAQLAVATRRDGNVPEGLPLPEAIKAYGRAVAAFCLDAEFHEIEPILNITHRRILLNVSNKIFMLLAKIQVIDNEVLRSGDKASDLMIASELGYAEFGKDMKIALIPGEIAPELIVGGCFDRGESYDGNAWEIEPLEKTVGGKLAVIGLCNDEIAYIIPDNDFGSLIAPLHYEESVSTGKHTASKLLKEFRAMFDAIERT